MFGFEPEIAAVYGLRRVNGEGLRE